MSLLERIRRFWKPRAGDDHPLTEQEREEERPAPTTSVHASSRSS
jgi:hypothetical protein